MRRACGPRALGSWEVISCTISAHRSTKRTTLSTALRCTSLVEHIIVLFAHRHSHAQSQSILHSISPCAISQSEASIRDAATTLRKGSAGERRRVKERAAHRAQTVDTWCTNMRETRLSMPSPHRRPQASVSSRRLSRRTPRSGEDVPAEAVFGHAERRAHGQL